MEGYYNIIYRNGLILGKTAVCEVKLLGDIEEDYPDSKVATNKIKIVRRLSTGEVLTKMDASSYANMPEISLILNHSIDELTHDQLDIILQSGDPDLIKGILEKRSTDDDLFNKVVRHPQWGVRKLLLSLKFYRDKDLDILVHDGIRYVRGAVAEKGRDKDLDILVHDENGDVREAVAEHGRDKDLDILVYDKYPDVRVTVAKHGRDTDLDILVHDENEYVREAVARQRRDEDLNILVHDTSLDVRFTVAELGRDKDLNILVHDANTYVRKMVTKHGRDKDLNILINDIDEYVRRIAINIKKNK